MMDVLYSLAQNKTLPTTEQDGPECVSELDDDEEVLDIGFQIEESEEIEITNESVKPLVTKVRKLVNLFKRSPLKNEILQK